MPTAGVPSHSPPALPPAERSPQSHPPAAQTTRTRFAKRTGRQSDNNVRRLRPGPARLRCRQRNGATQVGRKTKAIAAAGRTTSSCRHQRGGRPLGRCRQRATSRALLLFGPVLGTCVPRGKVAASASGSRTAAWACGSDQSQVFAGARSGEPGWPARVCRFHGRHVPPKSR